LCSSDRRVNTQKVVLGSDAEIPLVHADVEIAVKAQDGRTSLYLQCGEFVEDGRAALEGLRVALDGMGGERAKQKIGLLNKQLDMIEKLVAAECVNWQLAWSIFNWNQPRKGPR
jgi:hypothetical protein